MGILEKIVTVAFPKDQYISEKTAKTQIVLHHTVSPKGVLGDIRHWINDKRRIATCIIIGHTGVPYQLFSSKYWAYHLGVGYSIFRELGVAYYKLDRSSIGVEIDSSGGLVNRGGKWYDAYNHVLDIKDIVLYPKGYRGYYAFERYTDEQIETLRELLIFWGDRYGIPLKHTPAMFDVCGTAIIGKPGIWSHTSYRADKSDVHPQKELVEMLKSL